MRNRLMGALAGIDPDMIERAMGSDADPRASAHRTRSGRIRRIGRRYDAVPGSRAADRGKSCATQGWFGQEPNPYFGQPGEHATLIIGPERTRRAAAALCVGGLRPILLTTRWADTPSAQA